MSILEELWYGNASTGNRYIRKGSAYALAVNKATDFADSLLSDSPPELQEKPKKLLDMQIEAATIAERDAFIMGFRLASQLLVDGLTVQG